MRSALVGLMGLGLVAQTSCDDDATDSGSESVASAEARAAPRSSAPTAKQLPASSAKPSEPQDAGFPHPQASSRGCPTDMVRVEGEYCPAVAHHCLEHHEDYRKRPNDPTVSERCLRYDKPSRCIVDRRQHLAFCMDRYEYPNRIGELPRVLTSWRQARKLCKEQGKRLCTEREFNFACEGPNLTPHVYGYTRDPQKCNIDRSYRQPDHSRRLLPYSRCLQDEWCSAELERLDQRHRIGSRLSCVSWAGVVDLNGNVNEWVRLRHREPPGRSGLKGGWWGPVRNRCRPTVRFHKEHDYGYEVGFRCCKDVDDAGPHDAGP